MSDVNVDDSDNEACHHRGSSTIAPLQLTSYPASLGPMCIVSSVSGLARSRIICLLPGKPVYFLLNLCLLAA